MNTPEEHQKFPSKEVSKKFPQFFSKKSQRTIFISAVLFFVCLVLVVFIQKPQVLLQQASTGAPNNCATVPYYCLILGSGKSCSKPPVCPTPIPSAGFVPQANPNPNPASKSAAQAPASASPSAECTTPPAVLTTKLIIHFATDVGSNNGYTIQNTDKQSLDAYAAALKKYPNAVVTINGYTDSVPFAAGTTGPITNNQQLSLARAQAAENYLKTQGATQNKYVVNGNGATNFVASNNPQTGNILNRRDEITTNLGATSCTSTTTKGVLIMSNVTAHTNNGTGDYCLSAAGGNASISQCSGSDANQQWNINTNGTITNNGNCLDIANQQTANGSKVTVATCNGGKSQLWSAQTITSGPATGQTEIFNTNSGKCLGDPNFAPTNGNQQQIATCNGTDNLSWFTSPSALGSSLACTQNLSDNYYAGYVFSAPTASKLTVSGKWIVNSFTCKNGDNSYSQWPGIGNYKNGNLAQVGSYNICNGTTATYNNPWTMAFPAPFVDPPASDIIKVQDVMAASIQMTKPGTFTTVLSDKTQGWTYTRAMSFKGNNWTADYNGLILEAEGNDAHASNSKKAIEPLPQFHDAYYENVSYSLNGSANTPLSKVPDLSCDNSEYQSGSNYIIQDNTSPIRNDSFYVTWLRGE